MTVVEIKILAIFALCWHAGNGVEITITSAERLIKVGQPTYFSISVRPVDNAVCILNFGDGDCALVLDQNMINVRYSDDEYGVAADHTYLEAGYYTCSLVCHGQGMPAYKEISVSAPYPLKGLALIPQNKDRTVPIAALNGHLRGSLNFTFESGTELQGTWMTDDGAEGVVNIDEEAKAGFVSFSQGDFASHGTYAINITVYNLYNNSNQFYSHVEYQNIMSLEATVLYEELITDVRIEAPSQVLSGSLVTIAAKIGSGSRVSIIWTCSSNLPCFDVSTGQTHQHNFSHPGHYTIGLRVQNELGNVTKHHSLDVQLPVEGFSVSWEQTSIYLHTPDKDLTLIGDLFVQIQDESSSMILPQKRVLLNGRKILILENVPVNGGRLQVRVFSNLSSDLLEVEKNITDTIPAVRFSVQSKPEITLPDGVASFNVQSQQPSSNASNTICIIDFDDSSPTIQLSFREMIASDVKHTFTKGGIFNVTFVCENEIEFWIIEIKPFAASDFKFSYPDALPWNSTAECSKVIIHILLEGFSQAPSGVNMVWNFGDDTAVERLKLQSWSVIHAFSARGYYNMSVEVIVNGTDNFTTVLPIQIGLLHFTAFPRDGVFNGDTILFNISGAHGNLVMYELDFGDGTKKSFNKTNVDQSMVVSIPKVFRETGSFQPRLLVWSNLFEEDIFLPFDIRISSWNASMSLFMDSKVNYPPGTANVTFSLHQEVIFGKHTLMWCTINFDDGSPSEKFAFEPRLKTPFEYAHTFSAVGKMNVQANCSFDNETIIFVQNQTNVVSNCYGSSNPFSILNKVIKSTVSERVTIVARPDILCMNITPEFTWRVESNGIQVSIQQPNSSLLVLHPRSMKAGMYRVVFYTNFVEIPTIYISDSVILVYEQTPLQASIKGGNYKTIGQTQPVTLDALTHSYDPDMEPYKNHNLKFSWICSSHGSKREAYESLSNAPVQGNPCADTDMVAEGLVVLVANCLQVSQWHKFQVTVSKDNRTATNYQIIHVVGSPLQVDLRCKVNCLDKVDAQFSLSLYTECLDCSVEEKAYARYSWNLYSGDYADVTRQNQVSLEAITSTGSNISALSIRSYSLIPGKYYSLEVKITHTSNRSTQALGYNFMVNFPPYNGTCTLVPAEGVAVLDKFQVTCSGWVDEGYKLKRTEHDDGDFLTYQFILNVRNKSSILFSGGSSKTSWQELNPGDKDDDYRVTVTARVFDRHKGMAEVNLKGRAIPPIRQSDTPVKQEELEATLDLFQEKLSRSVVGRDAHQVFRTAEAASSVLNSLVFRESTSALDTADLWIERTPQSVNKRASPSWTELWEAMENPEVNNERNKVRKTASVYAQQLASLMNTTKPSSLVSVHMASTSVASVINPKNIDDEGLESAVETVGVVGESLSSVVDTEMSDVQVGEALHSVFGSVGNIISAMVQESPREESLGSQEETRRVLGRRKSFMTKEEQAGEMADLHDDERIFIITRRQLMKDYKFEKQNQLAMKTLPSLLRTVDKALNVASTFMVEGQEPTVFHTSELTGRVQRNLVSRLVSEEHQMEGVKLHMSLRNDSTVDPTQEATLKATLHQTNPFLYGNGGLGGRISSQAVRLQVSLDDPVEDTDPVNLTSSMNFMFDVPNPTPVPTSTVTPKYISLDRDKMLYHRTELKSLDDNLVIYIQPTTTGISYDVYFRSGEFPTTSTFDFRASVDFKDGSKLRQKSVTCPAGALPFNGTIYVALKPVILEPQESHKVHGPVSARAMPLKAVRSGNYTLHAPYDLAITTVGCRTWDDILDLWSPDICVMVDISSDLETRCKCEQSSFASFTVGTTFYVPANTIDFSTVFTKIDLLDNSGVLAVTICLFVLYVMLAVWAKRKDRQDSTKLRVTYLEDNLSQDKYLYMVTVYTGIRPGAGTHSRVGFVIAGDAGDTGIRALSDGVRKGFERQSITHFIMAEPRWLGDLHYIRVWHDNSGRGSRASWFVHKFVVEDIQRGQKFVFHCGRWLAVDEDDGEIGRVLPVSGYESRNFSKVFYNKARKNVTDNHIWFSVVLRPQRSSFTRFQRLSTCLCFLFLTMISNALYFHSEENIVRPTAINIGFLRFSLHQLYVSVIGTLIVTPASIVIVWLFTKSKPSKSILEPEANEDSSCSPTCCLSSGAEDQVKLTEAFVTKGFYKTKSLTLPHCCVYIAWAMLIFGTATSAFFLFLFSQQWGKAKSEEWLTSFILSFFESLLVVDPIKVIIISLLMALFVRKQDDSATDGPSKEIKSTPYSDRDNKPSAGDVGRLNQPPLTAEKVDAIRVKERNKAKAFDVVKEILLYLIFLLVIYTIGYTNRDPRSFNSRENIYNMMVYKQKDKRPGLVNVITTADVFRWLNLTALPALFHEQYYNGSRRTWRDRYYMRDLQNFRVGPPRLRQVRGKRLSECLMSKLPFIACNAEYNMYNGESREFCVGWKNPPCPKDDRISKFTSSAWRFTPATDIWGVPIFGRYNSYIGGGYIAQLDVNWDVSLTMLNELYSELWIDRQTRALTLEFTVYNANVNLFSYVSLMVEFPETGGTMQQYFVSPFRIYQHVGALGSYILLNEIMFLVFLAIAIMHFSLKLRKHGFAYMNERWHILDFVCIVTSIVGVAMYCVRDVMANYSLDRLHEDPRQFINFQHVTIWDEVMVDIIGLVSSIVTVRTLKILGYSRRVSAITRILTNAGSELFFFSIIFFIVFLAFVLLGYMLFGTELEAYHTFLMTCSTLMTSMIGKTPFDEMRRREPLLAQAYFALFVFFVVLVLLTMFLAILNDSIAVVRAADKEDSSQQEMLMLLLQKLKESLSLFFPSLARQKKYSSESADGNGSEDENSHKINKITNKVDPNASRWNIQPTGALQIGQHGEGTGRITRRRFQQAQS